MRLATFLAALAFAVPAVAAPMAEAEIRSELVARRSFGGRTGAGMLAL